jgi:hypothetical protein
MMSIDFQVLGERQKYSYGLQLKGRLIPPPNILLIATCAPESGCTEI